MLPQPPSSELVGPETLLEKLFPVEQDRPSRRWLTDRVREGVIPYIKVGHLTWYSVPQVDAALRARTIVRRRR